MNLGEAPRSVKARFKLASGHHRLWPGTGWRVNSNLRAPRRSSLALASCGKEEVDYRGGQLQILLVACSASGAPPQQLHILFSANLGQQGPATWEAAGREFKNHSAGASLQGLIIRLLDGVGLTGISAFRRLGSHIS